MPQHNTHAKNIKARQPYSTDISDKQWSIITPLIPPAKSGGRKRQIDEREIINAIFYLLKTGCQWQLLPHNFPKWKTVHDYFRKWKDDGTWKNIHNALREKVRVKSGRKKQPSAGIIDSQSVKTAEKGGFMAMTLVKK